MPNNASRITHPIITILGDLLWDVFIPASKAVIPVADSAIHLDNKSSLGLYPGGTTNLAAALAISGIQKNHIHLIATAGKDHAGQSLVDEASKYCTVHPTLLENTPTGFVICYLHENNERGMLVSSGASSKIDSHHVPVDVLQQSDFFIGYGFYLINDHKKAAFRHALRAIPNSSIFAFDPGSAGIIKRNIKYIETLLATRIDIFLPNRKEFCVLMNCQEVTEQKIREFFDLFSRVQVLSITLGEEGAITATRSDGIVTKEPAKSVTVVDTTGAGDAYAGAFLGTLIIRDDPVTATRFGIEVSSRCIQYIGGHEYTKHYNRQKAEQDENVFKHDHQY